MLCLALILVSVRSIAVSKPTRPAVAKSTVHELPREYFDRIMLGDTVDEDADNVLFILS